MLTSSLYRRFRTACALLTLFSVALLALLFGKPAMVVTNDEALPSVPSRMVTSPLLQAPTPSSQP
ncbi:MAG: hypothetical protein AAFQ53_09990, partial [Bacteroidota bacterium]